MAHRVVSCPGHPALIRCRPSHPALQISRAILTEDQRLRLPRFMDKPEDLASTKEQLQQKIAELNK